MTELTRRSFLLGSTAMLALPVAIRRASPCRNVHVYKTASEHCMYCGKPKEIIEDPEYIIVTKIFADPGDLETFTLKDLGEA